MADTENRRISSIEEDFNERNKKRIAHIEAYLNQVESFNSEAAFDLVAEDLQATDHRGRRLSHLDKRRMDELREKSHNNQIGWMGGKTQYGISALKVATGALEVFTGVGRLAPTATAGVVNNFLGRAVFELSGENAALNITKSMEALGNIAKGTELVSGVPSTYTNAKSTEHGSDKQQMETNVHAARTSKDTYTNAMGERIRKVDQKEYQRHTAMEKMTSSTT